MDNAEQIVKINYLEWIGANITT